MGQPRGHETGGADKARVALVAVVLGADSIIGHHIALKCADEGARLILIGNDTSKPELEQLGRQCACIGAPAVDIYSDPIRDAEAIHEMARSVISRQGGIDVLILTPTTIMNPGASTVGSAVDVLEHIVQETVPQMKQKQTTKARCTRGIVTLIPDPDSMQASGAAAAIGSAAAGATSGIVGAKITEVAHKMNQKLGLGSVMGEHRKPPSKEELQQLGRRLLEWTDKQAQELCPGGGHMVDVLVPIDPLYLSLTKVKEEEDTQGAKIAANDPDWQKVRSVAAAVAKAALSPWVDTAKGSNTSSNNPSAAPITVVSTTSFDDKAGAAPHVRMKVADALGPEETENMMKGGGAGAAAARQYPAGPEKDHQSNVPGGGSSEVQELMLGGSGDPEAVLLGHDPGPAPGATYRARHPHMAVWLPPQDPPSAEGIVEATGKRKEPGALTRLRAPGELGLGKQDKSGAVLAKADPANLEPAMNDKSYAAEPQDRHPNLMVHCWFPFNGETPHKVLSKEFITPAELFYVRNHLPVPETPHPDEYRLKLGGVGVKGELSLSLEDLRSGKYGNVVEEQVTLQCAGNRRNEVAAVKLVEGRAPWNHGAMGNSIWTGVMMRDVLAAAGFPVNDPEGVCQPPPQHLVMEGMDWHRESGKHFEVSIPLSKVLDPRGGVMLAWLQNHKPLLPDHGFPLRMIVPGYVGTRSVKWLRSVSVSVKDSQSSWQQVDYKLMPHRFHTLPEWKPNASCMPAIENMNTQSAILEPEAGSTIPKGTHAVWVRGYAWCGAGLAIIRVDVTADEGSTWESADLVEQHAAPHGQAWAWTKWQIPLEVPEHLRKNGGKWRIACKAWNRNGDTQPAKVSDVWNFRGLACNSWHFTDLHVEA